MGAILALPAVMRPESMEPVSRVRVQ
jgi:hypothetical protein